MSNALYITVLIDFMVLTGLAKVLHFLAIGNSDFLEFLVDTLAFSITLSAPRVDLWPLFLV